MLKKIVTLLVPVIAGSLFLQACDQASTSMGASGPKVSLQIQAGISPVAARSATVAAPSTAGSSGVLVTDSLGHSVVLTRAEVWISRIEFKTTEGMDTVKREVKAGPILVNLLAGTSSSSLSDLSVPEGIYDRLTLEVGKAEANNQILDSTNPMVGKSFWLEGTVDGVPFHIGLDFEREIDFPFPAAVRLGPDSLTTLVARMDPATWFSAADVGACAHALVTPQGDVSSACEDLRKTVDDHMKGSSHGQDLGHLGKAGSKRALDSANGGIDTWGRETTSPAVVDSTHPLTSTTLMALDTTKKHVAIPAKAVPVSLPRVVDTVGTPVKDTTSHHVATPAPRP